MYHFPIAGLPHFNGAVYPKYPSDNSSTEYMLDEYTCSLGGRMECSGYYTLNCSASGATRYTFQVYSENKGFINVSTDECAYVEHEVRTCVCWGEWVGGKCVLVHMYMRVHLLLCVLSATCVHAHVLRNLYTLEVQLPPLTGHHCSVPFEFPSIDVCTFASSERGHFPIQDSLLW